MPDQRKVTFGRINRRQQTLDTRPFSEEMSMLLAMESMTKEIGDRTWIAADLSLDDSGVFLKGMIGFEQPDQRVHYDDDVHSWVKSKTSVAEGASSKAVVPFAVDLRDDHRWTANASSPRIQPATFGNGLEVALNAARDVLGFPTDWEVNLVTSRAVIEQWLLEHPDVRMLRRTVRLPNPGLDLSEDIEEMRQLAARTKKEEFTAHYDRNLRSTEPSAKGLNEMFRRKIEGVETGQLDVYIEARGPGMSYTFNSRRAVDHTYISDYGDDWELGMEFVVDALRGYSDRRAEEAQVSEQAS